MKFEDLFENKLLVLPKSIPKECSYLGFITKILNDYLTLLKSVSEKTIKIKGLRYETKLENICKNQTQFVEGILNTLKIYLDGKPAQAYETFSNTMDERLKKYKKMLSTKEFNEGESFYRLRKSEGNYAFTTHEMFHVPFELRGTLNTQRYSIPGFPSLYLGKTIYVAWEELKRPMLENFQAVRLRSTKKITYLDLTVNDWGTNNMNKDAYKYFMTWPLIAACSIQVKNTEHTFKQEYIIPQLLLQWIRNTNVLDAIIYQSTHIKIDTLTPIKDMYNIVIPVKGIQEVGYCNDLMKMFTMTETVSKQLIDVSSGGAQFIYMNNELLYLDNKLPTIEFIKGQKFPYSYSVLGKMEYQLDIMPTEQIENLLK